MLCWKAFMPAVEKNAGNYVVVLQSLHCWTLCMMCWLSVFNKIRKRTGGVLSPHMLLASLLISNIRLRFLLESML